MSVVMTDSLFAIDGIQTAILDAAAGGVFLFELNGRVLDLKALAQFPVDIRQNALTFRGRNVGDCHVACQRIHL